MGVLTLLGSSTIAYVVYKYLSSQDYESKDWLKDKHQDKLEEIADNPGLLGVFNYENDTNDKIHPRQCVQRYYKPLGLPNLGNTCYMNSLIQVLVGSQRFMSYIKKLWTTIQVDPEDKNNIIAFTLMQLLINLHHGSKETSPYDLYQILVNSDFSGIYE